MAVTLAGTVIASVGVEPSDVALTGVIVVFGALGLILAERRPTNPIGWILLTAATLWSIGGVGIWYASNGGERGWPLAHIGPILFTVTFFPGLALSIMPLLALFPTGRLLSTRWRWVLWSAATFGVIAAVGNSLIEIDAGSKLGEALVGISIFPLLAGLGGGIASLVIRYRTGSTVVRQQLKWFLAAAVVLPVALLVGEVFKDHPYLPSLVGAAGLLQLPVAVAIAVLRYRLYEIDRIVSRTVTYGLLTAMLAGVYFGLVFLLGELLPFEGQLPVAASTLAVAALFSPLRRRVQGMFDRRFNRSHYDAVRTIEAFSSRLRADIDVTDLSRELVEVTMRTVQPASAGVWTRLSAEGAQATGSGRTIAANIP